MSAPTRLEAALAEGRFAITSEIGPPKSADPSVIAEKARMLGPVTDALNIYRIWRREIALDPDFEFYLRGPVLEPLVTGYCGLKGLRSAEIPGDEPPRIGGATKRSIVYNGSMVLLMIVRLYLRKFLGIRV